MSETKSTMKYVVVPEPVEVLDNGKIIEYSLGQFLSENIWTDPKWRLNGKDWIECVLRLQPKFKGSEPGDIIEMSEKDFAKLSERVIMPDMKLPPNLNIPFMQLQQAVLNALDTAPTKKEKLKKAPASKEAAEG